MTHHMAKSLMPVKRQLQLSKAESGSDRISSRSQTQHTHGHQPSQLLLCDFDHTLADFDTGDFN